MSGIRIGVGDTPSYLTYGSVISKVTPMNPSANRQAELDILILGNRVAAALVVENAPTLYPEDHIASIVFRGDFPQVRLRISYLQFLPT